MDVILLERIEKLGHIGDVVKVKNGYARNFLLPRGKALRANDANRKVFEANRTKIEADNEQRRESAEKDAKTIDGASVKLIRQASNTGQLYGSVSARDLAEALEAQGHKVAKNQIILDRPIKAIGVQEVRVALHPEVSVAIKVNVARSPEEAELQAQGVNVMQEMFERDEAGFIEELEPGAEPGEIPEEPETAAEEVHETEEAAEVEQPAEVEEASEPVEVPEAEDASEVQDAQEIPEEESSEAIEGSEEA